MAQWEKRTKTTTTHEYVLPNPANCAEVGKAMSAAYSDYTSITGKSGSDDCIWVTHSDEEIIIYWEQEA